MWIISKLFVWSKTLKGAQQYFKTLIQFRFYLLVYGSWHCSHVWHSCFLFCSLRVLNYKIVKWVPLSADWLQRKNLKTLRVQVPWRNGKQMCICCIFSFLIMYNIFLLKWDFLWSHFVTQNVKINIFLPTYPPKTSDWRFAWQNGYGRRPLPNT